MSGKSPHSSLSGELEQVTLLDIMAKIPSPLDIETALPRPSLSPCRDSRVDQCSSNVAAMEPDRDSEGPATSQAAPSLSGPTQTSEPIPKADRDRTQNGDSSRPPLPTQIRDHQRYHFLGEHGRGGLGRVSRAHDRELGRDVAIKELLSRSNANEVRFLREVLITARLEHPGIVPVHEAGRWADGTPFYAMKLVAGRSLRDLIAERPRAEDRIDLLHHVIAVADAIAYAHGRNIIHRDLKPANVIVGDFGETIVIDWGLAKDLTSTEPSIAGSSPLRASTDEDLTSTGSVLGTPAYMAPEQKRGEPVDQRADVFAIGTMLWEICAPQKIPPASVHHRRHLLRRAGIDPDLAAIIEKALEPDPLGRYPHAGALAADLKAFKSGTRIAARSYSLPAMLAHWTRRHRALALSTVAAIVIAVTASLVYVRNVAAERDRADTSDAVSRRALASADASRASAEASLEQVKLKNAELLLTTDPSAAIDVLENYHGTDVGRAHQIRAHATGLGVPVLRAVPHTDNVRWIQAAPDGTILSLSLDGTITRTALDGTSIVIARNVSRSSIATYSSSRHLLAYTCDPSDLCLFDVARAMPIPAAAMLRDANAIAIALSPDGTLLATMSRGSRLKVFDVTDPARPAVKVAKPIDGGVDVKFVGADVVVAGTMTGIEFVRLNGDSERHRFPDLSRWAMDRAAHRLALATTRGQALVLESFPLRVAARADLCHGPTADLHFLPGQHIAYACNNGVIGIWDLQQGTVSARGQLEGQADLITASATGDLIIAAGSNGSIAVLDLVTNLTASYKGHGFRLTAIAPPTPEHPFLLSADARGAIRAWQLPRRLARVAATSSSPFSMAIFDRQSSRAVATTSAPALTVAAPSTAARAEGPHVVDNIYLERSRNGSTFATYGLQDVIEVWSFMPIARTLTLDTGHGSVSQLQFVDDTDDFITSGRDGRLVRWTPDGRQTQLARFDRPIDRFAAISAANTIVFSTTDGALWRTDAAGQVLSLGPGGSRVNRIRATADQQTIYVGYAAGDLLAIDTRTWEQESLLHGAGAGAVREVAITADGHSIAVATNDGIIHVGSYGDAARSPGRLTWVPLALRARDIALTPDGLLLASCTDGTIWLYSLPRARWLCLPTGTVDLGRTAVADNGNAAVAVDYKGRLIWIDLEAARKQLDVTSNVPSQ